MFEVLLNHQALETLGTTNVIVDEICGEGTWAEYVARCQRWEDSQAKKEALTLEKEEKKMRLARKNLKNRSRCGSLARFQNYIYIIIWRMTSLTYGFALRMV